MKFITSKKEYREVYDDNKRLVNNLFIFLIKKIPENFFHVGIVVSKKVGNAVVRNKVKRRLRAFLRENEQLHPTNMKLIIIAKTEVGNAKWKKFKEDLIETFKTFENV